MWGAVSDGLTYLFAQSWRGFLELFWYTAIFELPRYTLAFAAAAFFIPHKRNRKESPPPVRVTVIVAGHNEEESIERCLLSLREQSRPPDELIVVSDGSTDRMAQKLRMLQRSGLVDQVHCTDLRAGKSAGMNLAERWASGDIIINADCDCSFDRHAIRNILIPFADPAVGAVSGNVLVRNAQASFITAYQAIEYLISLSLSKQAAELIDQVTCISGAFGAFRKPALEGVGGVDVGSGEDFDLTLRLRRAGWKVRFREDAICYTDVPATLRVLIRQRFRWERDAVRLRYRKHGDLLNPFARRLPPLELVHEVDFLFFHVFGALVLPFYVIWLVLEYGELTLMILLAAQAGLVTLDVLTFALAAWATPKADCHSLFPYVFGYGVFDGMFMRFVRLSAYLQEWLFNASAKDTYVPEKVLLLRRW